MSEIPVFNQQQTPGVLGRGPDSIAAAGCFLCAKAQTLQHYGLNYPPEDLNRLLVDMGVFVDCGGGAIECLPDNGLERWGIKTTYSSGDQFFGQPADLSQLAQLPNEECWIELDFDHTPNDGVQTHWVRCYAYDAAAGVIRIQDPWYGAGPGVDETWVFTDHYGQDPQGTIIKIVRVQLPGWPKGEPAPVVSPPASDPFPHLPFGIKVHPGSFWYDQPDVPNGTPVDVDPNTVLRVDKAANDGVTNWYRPDIGDWWLRGPDCELADLPQPPAPQPQPAPPAPEPVNPSPVPPAPVAPPGPSQGPVLDPVPTPTPPPAPIPPSPPVPPVTPTPIPTVEPLPPSPAPAPEPIVQLLEDLTAWLEQGLELIRRHHP